MRNCRDLTDFGREIRATVLQRTHLTVGVGIAQTKTLAKLANHAAKKWQRQTGGWWIYQIWNASVNTLLSPWMTSGGLDGGSAKTDVMGIKTVLDLADTDIRFIRKHFNVVLERTVRELRGEPCLQLEEFAPRSRKLSVPARLVNASRIIHRCGRPFVVTLPGRRKNFAASINIVGFIPPYLLRRHHLRSMTLLRQ